MIRKKKKFERPRKLFDIVRIKSENLITKKYGLKNKREIWRAITKLKNIRRKAKNLVNQDYVKQQELLEKLNKMGFKVKNIIDVLALTEEDILRRRLQSIVLEKRISTTPKGARQLITHKHILIDGKIVNVPSYLVNVDEEGKISTKKIKTKINDNKIKGVSIVANE